MTAGKNFPCGLTGADRNAEAERNAWSSAEKRHSDLTRACTDLYRSEMSLKACANSVLCFNRTPKWKHKPDD